MIFPQERFIVLCQRQCTATTMRTLRESHATLQSAVEALQDHQQRAWDSVMLTPRLSRERAPESFYADLPLFA